jgi:prepilin-type N-terminal cleavage/methylation domain-containing protein
MHTSKAFTLIELLIAIAVALLITQGFTSLFVQTWETNKFILETGLASSLAQRTNNKIVKELRGVQQSASGSYPVVSAGDFDLTVYDDIDDDGVVERVHYYLDGTSDEMRMGITEPNTGTLPVTYPSGDQSTVVMAKYVVNEPEDPIFYYYNGDYPGDTTNNPLSGTFAVGDIQLIRIKLEINIDPIRAPNNIYIESFVDLRNLQGYE